MRMRLLAGVIVWALVCPGVSGAVPPRVIGVAIGLAWQDADAVMRTKRAAKMIQEKSLNAALEELDRALDDDDGYWETYYQRGRALGLLGRMEESRDALLQALELNPGFAHGHYLAWLAAMRIGDYETAWEQAIQAELSGTDMSEDFKHLVEVSAVPEDILKRLAAPRIFVAPIETSDIEAAAEIPYNRDPREEPNRFSDRPDEIQGAFRVQETAAELNALHRHLRQVILRAPYLGLTLDPQLSALVLRIHVERISERSPRELKGQLEVTDIHTNKMLYRRQILLRNIASPGSLVPQLDQIFADIEASLMESIGPQKQ